MTREQKEAFVGEFRGQLEGAKAIYLADFTGLNVKQVTEFRSRLRREGVEYRVVKNRLAQRALEGLDLPDVAGFFTGPTGVLIGTADSVTPARVLTDFAREFGDRPAVKVALVERREYGPEQVKQLAELPPKEVLLARLAGGLQAPMARLAGGMNQVVAGLARGLDALRRQREASQS